MSVNYRAVGLRIKRFRMERGISQEELAFQVNTSSAYISNIENGHKRPSLSKLTEISEVLGVTLNDLIYASSPYSFEGSAELNEMISLFTPDKQKLLIDHMSAIIKSVIIK
ncbi:MAG: helix-turn-helix transcriptional regulator [Lachnospiraceae bacterium]|nr:helix-turn-helix transcriptional regulator [Lachnospiraceae bacterium]